MGSSRFTDLKQLLVGGFGQRGKVRFRLGSARTRSIAAACCRAQLSHAVIVESPKRAVGCRHNAGLLHAVSCTSSLQLQRSSLQRSSQLGHLSDTICKRCSRRPKFACQLIDDLLLRDFPRLRVIACTFRLPEHIDVAACTRRGVWVTSVATRWPGTEAEIEAARNILDVFSGDTPRGAMNEVLPSAA